MEDLEDLFENAPCAYLSMAPDGCISKANALVAAWTGYANAQLVGKRFSDLLNIAGRIYYETHFAPLLRMQGFFNEVALDLVTVAGERVPVIANAVERRNANGDVLFTRLALFKATDRRRYERELLNARLAERETSELREQFIAVLGHDLRNPLSSIGAGVHLLRTEKVSDRGAAVLDRMHGSVMRMSGLIDDVLDFARGRLGGGIALTRVAHADLEPVLQQVVAELRAGAADREIIAAIDLREPVDCDVTRIGQLVSNLLGNALTHGLPDPPVRLQALTRDGSLQVAVANAGTPIPPEVMGRLFQPFFRGDVRASQQGLGLGLHIASEIAKAHGGTLTVRSSPVETCFTFAMPTGRAEQSTVG